jgi:hypothetical protein
VPYAPVCSSFDTDKGAPEGRALFLVRFVIGRGVASRKSALWPSDVMQVSGR